MKKPATLGALFFWLLVLSQPVIAFARAGGGQHYHGSGGGYGGGYGGGLWSLWPLLFLGHGTGFGGLIFILILVYLYQQSQKRSGGGAWNWTNFGGPQSFGAAVTDDDARGRIVAGPPAAAQSAIADGIAAIKTRDPNFDEQAFIDRANTAFFTLQQAWNARNQDIARGVMSDALYERHKMQTDQLIAHHQIDVLENVVIGHSRIVAVHPGQPYDSVVVAFDASMTDYTIDENTKRVVDGDQSQQLFSERWTFIRRADAKSASGQTQLANTCPACGAPLTLKDGKCAYCGGYVRSLSSDWVVDSIEQA
ncbi:MAG: TIM44-like domain-containing protein [Candidatus Eremiobacteraeota bacterium]|nr:TIM44-like domain-containing protein [Candidatus Eremiobacteraeota bacterium]